MKAWHAEAKRLREEGRTVAEIAKRFGVARSTASCAIRVRPSTTYRGAPPGMDLEARERRRAAVAALRRREWAIHRIACALDLADKTVSRDLAATGVPDPERVVGRDGRRFPARRGGSR